MAVVINITNMEDRSSAGLDSVPGPAARAWGERGLRADSVRRACYGPAGLAVQACFNLTLLCLTTFALAYDLAVVRTSKPPLWFVALDCAIVAVLVVEVALRTAERGGCGPYLARPANRFELAVAVLSVLGLGVYLFENSRYSDDAETAVFAFRVVRDVVRLGRVVFFLRTLRDSIVEFRAADDSADPYTDVYDALGGANARELMATPTGSPALFSGPRSRN